MKRSVRFPVILVALFSFVSCNDSSQDNGSNKQDTNYSDTRRNAGDTGYYIKTDSAQQKDVIDVNPPQKRQE